MSSGFTSARLVATGGGKVVVACRRKRPAGWYEPGRGEKLTVDFIRVASGVHHLI